jgi:hypothetical protein
MSGDIWGLLNQDGWSTTDSINIAISDAKLVFLSGSGANDDVRYTEPPVGGIATSITGQTNDNQFWDYNYGSNLATTGGTGRGLTVNVGDGGSGFSCIAINNPGSGYTTGDTITVTNGPFNGAPFASTVTFTITASALGVWTHVAIVNNAGTQTVWYNGVEQTKVSGTFGSANYANSTDILAIGNMSGGNNYFDGKMAMVRISSNAKYTEAFTATTTYGVEGDTRLFLNKVNPTVDSKSHAITNNGVTTSTDFP